MIEAILSRLDGDDEGTVRLKLRAFQVILALVVGTEYWTKALARRDLVDLADLAALLVVVPLVLAVLQGRFRREAFAGLACLQALYIWRFFPQVGNHRYLEFVFALLFATLDDEDLEEQKLGLRSLRWLVLVVLFYSGLQKLVQGYYLRGEYLAFSMWRETFRNALAPLLSVAEFERLTSYTGAVGDGPYRTGSPGLIALSNAIWIAELTLAPLLFARRTRAWACFGACVFLLLVEGVAREFLFGIEFGCAILLFARGRLLRYVVWVVACVLLLLLLMRLELLPAVNFH